jgi:hypothetical protein
MPKKNKSEDTRLVCAACGRPADRQRSIHRDGFCRGPEVALCYSCGGYERPTCEDIYDAIALRRGRNKRVHWSAWLYPFLPCEEGREFAREMKTLKEAWDNARNTRHRWWLWWNIAEAVPYWRKDFYWAYLEICKRDEDPDRRWRVTDVTLDKLFQVHGPNSISLSWDEMDLFPEYLRAPTLTELKEAARAKWNQRKREFGTRS